MELTERKRVWGARASLVLFLVVPAWLLSLVPARTAVSPFWRNTSNVLQIVGGVTAWVVGIVVGCVAVIAVVVTLGNLLVNLVLVALRKDPVEWWWTFK